MKLRPSQDSTPLDPEQLEGLIPDLQTQTELNEFEALNIRQALVWAQKSRKLKKNLITVTGLLDLHKRMFDQTWKWAGTYRKTETNIGIEPRKIPDELYKLCGDVLCWIDNKTYPLDEIAARFHHRLAYIHPFPNGNGRHARLAANLLMEYRGEQRFAWGVVDLVNKGQSREEYLKALREADSGKIDQLLKFAKSGSP